MHGIIASYYRYRDTDRCAFRCGPLPSALGPQPLPPSNPIPRPRPQVPDLVTDYMKGTTLLDKYITHNMKFDQINE